MTRAVTEKGETKQQKIRSWVRQAPDGGIVFFMRAGFQPIDLAKGKAGLAVPSMEKLPGVIDMLIEAVRNGELDEQLAAAATQSRRKKAADSLGWRQGASWPPFLFGLAEQQMELRIPLAQFRQEFLARVAPD